MDETLDLREVLRMVDQKVYKTAEMTGWRMEYMSVHHLDHLMAGKSALKTVDSKVEEMVEKTVVQKVEELVEK